MRKALIPNLVVDPDRAFFGHPRGLMYLAAMEGFERFSYYGMQALLVLYMTGRLFTPGVIDHVIGFAPFRAGLEAVFGSMTLQALALQIFGLYGGLVFLLPVVGGYVGDQLFGRRPTIIAGLVVMAIGHALMAFEQTFLFALLALLTGSALLKGNVAAQVGSVSMGRRDSRRDQGFSIFLMASNTGAVLSPLVCGTLGEVYGWRYGFGAAAIVVVIGLVIYLVTSRYLPNDPPQHKARTVVAFEAGDGARIAMLAALAAIASLFWVAQSQIWNAYPVWSRDRVDRHLLDFEIPVTWFQSIDSLGTIVFGPVVIWLWARQRNRGTEPGDLTKVVWGSLFFAGSEMLLAAGELAARGGKRRHRLAAQFPHPVRDRLAVLHARRAGPGRAHRTAKHQGHRHRRILLRRLHRLDGQRRPRQILRRHPDLAVLGVARLFRRGVRPGGAGADEADESGAD